MVFITRFIIIFTIIIISNIFGLVDFDNLVFGGFVLQDASILCLLVYFICTYKTRIERNSKLLLPIFVYVILTTLIILSMPFRGDISLIRAFQVGRMFYFLLLAFVIEDNIYFEKSNKFVLSCIFFVGLYFAFVSIFYYIFPTNGLFKIFKGLGLYSSAKGEATRHGMTSNNAMLFVHLSFVIKILQILSDKINRNKVNFLLVFLFLLAMFTIGLRAIMYSILLALSVIMVFVFKNSIKKKVFDYKFIIRSVFFSSVFVLVVNAILDNAIFDIFYFTLGEITGDVKFEDGGTLDGRLQRALYYQIPTAQKHPWFGVGLVHKKSGLAQELGYIADATRYRSLYNIDFGYVSMWLIFGIIGLFLIIFSFIRSLFYILKFSQKYFSYAILTYSVIFLSFLICNYSFGVLFQPIGLIILAFSAGLASGERLLMLKTKQLVVFRN